MLNSYDIIKAPLYSEKATISSEKGKYVFKVSKESDKNQIKKAIENIFSVNVTKVSIMNSKSKSKVFKGVKGKRSGFKKAIVTIAVGENIELSKVV